MSLDSIRTDIDRIDDEIARLFKARMDKCAEEAALLPDSARRDPARERETLYRVTDITGKPLENYTRLLYGTLLNLGRGYQGTLADARSTAIVSKIMASFQSEPFPTKAVVACQGVEGAYSQQACAKLFPLPRIMYFGRFEGVFQAVECGMCRYGVLPIENSSAGSVTEVYDLIEKYHCSIVRSTRLQINHCLLAKKGVKLDDVHEIVSHEQAINQCGKFLSSHPKIKVTVFANTAAASKYVAESDRNDLAAIASENCAELYGLSVLSRDVQNSDHNYTRFICISKTPEIYPGASRITFMASLPHEPGSLASLISRFAAEGLNICKIESRPIPGRDFEFRFYFDIEADVCSPNTQTILAQLEKDALFVFLGAYSEMA